MKRKLTFAFLFLSIFSFGQNTILWKVTNAGNKNTSYLLGTYHLLGESFVESLPIIKEKLQASDMVITETKIDRQKLAAYYNARPASDTLFAILSKEDLDLVYDLFKQGRGVVDISKFTPGELFAKLQGVYPKFKCPALNKADKYTMDEYLQYLANQGKKEMYYFETDSFQLEKITQALSIYNWDFFRKNVPPLLKKYRNDIPNENLCSFANQYTSFAVDYNFGEKCAVLKNSQMNEDLVKKRNEDWMQKLPALLEKNNCFIAVGLGHYFNKCGIIQQLRALGYTVEPVTMK